MKQCKKFRQCFIYEQQYFVVDTHLNIDGIPSVLKIETTREGKDIQVPPFVKVLKEVTDLINYATIQMAKQDYKMPEADKIAIQEGLSHKNEKKKVLNAD